MKIAIAKPHCQFHHWLNEKTTRAEAKFPANVTFDVKPEIVAQTYKRFAPSEKLFATKAAG